MSKLSWNKCFELIHQDDKFIAGLIEEHFPTGSKYICHPAVTTTDEDWVIKVSPRYFQVVKDHMKEHGWAECGEDYEGTPGVFVAYRLADYNVILVRDQITFDEYKVATAIAKKLNLLDKDDRVWLFKQIRSIGNPYADVF